jgi:hypothetical protein
MAVILGDLPPASQRQAEPARTADVPRRAGSAPPPAPSGQRSEPRRSAPSRSVSPEPQEPRMRGPFEPPPKPKPGNGGQSSRAGDAEPSQPGSAADSTMSQAERVDVWSPATAKMDQIKDLYLTAEAIGEDALDKHFELVSDRQRQLIREYFDEVVASPADSRDAAT